MTNRENRGPLSEVRSLQKNTCPFPSEVDPGIRATKRLCCAESPDDIAVEQVRGGECSRHFESPKPPCLMEETGRLLSAAHGTSVKDIKVVALAGSKWYTGMVETRGCSSLVEYDLPKVGRRVRFPSAAGTSLGAIQGTFFLLRGHFARTCTVREWQGKWQERGTQKSTRGENQKGRKRQRPREGGGLKGMSIRRFPTSPGAAPGPRFAGKPKGIFRADAA